MIKVGLYSEDRTLHPLLSSALGKEFQIALKSDQQEMIDMVSSGECDVMVLDLNSKHESLQERISFSREQIATNIPSIVMADDSLRSTAFELVRTGAFGYCRRPPSIRDLKTMLSRAYENSLLKRQLETVQQRMEDPGTCDRLIGSGRHMQRVYQMVQRVTNLSAAVLVTGESGTGKELIARAIHFRGAFANRPFVAVDCGSLVPTLIESELFGYEKGAFTGALKSKQGLFQSADTGSVFLDEIGELPLELQAKLLRVLQEKEVRPVGSNQRVKVDVRIIAATNRDLEAAYRNGTFRKDLYFRLNVVTVHVPALRERRSDIPMLVNWFCERYAPGADLRVSSAAMKSLMNYDWPGNVRELENCVERAVALGNGTLIDLSDLPPSIAALNLPARSSSDSTPELVSDLAASAESISAEGAASVPISSTDLEDIERATIQRVFEQVKGDKALAGRMLGISRATLYRKLKRYNISGSAGPAPSSSHTLQ
jgi:DNA-binding NtrC family response regulator